jgi:hypothetical protein
LPGNLLTTNLTNLPQSGALVALGFSNTMYGAVQLPFDLAPVGMPGCSLRTSILLMQFVTGSNNTATWSLAVPNDQSLLGGLFYNQAFVIDPSANAGGLTVTNGARGRIGI